MDLSKFTFNKKIIEYNGNFRLQLSLLSNFIYLLMCSPVHIHGTIKNNHNYTVQNIHGISLHFFLNHTFLKYVMVSHYIYNLEFNWF